MDHVAEEVQGKSVLDLGCAEGVVSSFFADAGASSVHGVDSSPRRIASARRLFAGKGLTFSVVDLNNLPAPSGIEWPGATYDIVAMLGVYRYLDERRRHITLGHILDHCRSIFILRGGCTARAEAADILEDKGFALERQVAADAVSDLFLYRRHEQ
jgi:2-polyprenyl-3-methyl-5-hydroxy-6-metoxy-1,4-benzoquinol methylase